MDDCRQRHPTSRDAKGDLLRRMHGFQLWANLSSSLKMTDPRYQDIPSSAVPEITDDDGTHVPVICGEFWGKKGPVEDVAADPNYLDISYLRQLFVHGARAVFSGSSRNRHQFRALANRTGASKKTEHEYRCLG
jgi:redox-sensitive bicupin YhaK (pirin superfamily)